MAGGVVTAPSREVARHWHEQHDWWLVASTEDTDVWTYRDTGSHMLLRILDCDGTRIASSQVMPADAVADTVASHVAREVGQ
jgi:hypothetical protein